MNSVKHHNQLAFWRGINKQLTNSNGKLEMRFLDQYVTTFTPHSIQNRQVTEYIVVSDNYVPPENFEPVIFIPILYEIPVDNLIVIASHALLDNNALVIFVDYYAFNSSVFEKTIDIKINLIAFGYPK